jgi:hypothetical protein
MKAYSGRANILLIALIALCGAVASGVISRAHAADAGTAVVAATHGPQFSKEEERIIRETLGQVLGASNPNPKAARNDARGRHEDEHEDEHEKKHKRKKHPGERGGSGDMPPGLAKRDRLPPGLEKHVERTGQLPPGLQKRGLPPDLEARLSPLRAGARRVIVDRDVILIDEATNVVLDVLKNVLQPKK